LSERGVVVTLVAPDRPKGVPERVGVTSGALVAAAGSDAADGGRVERAVMADATVHECRMLCIESSRSPRTDLPRLAGAPCIYRPRLGGFLPMYDRTMALHGPSPAIYVAGDAGGVDTPRAAAESGRLAARCVLPTLVIQPDAEERIEESWRQLRAASAPLCARAREAHVAGAVPDEVIERWHGPEDTVLCPCTGVTAATLGAAVADGAVGPDDLKRLTRCGMGPCQWQRCGPAVMRWLSGALNIPIGRLALPRVRPPVRPIPVASFATWEDPTLPAA